MYTLTEKHYNEPEKTEKKMPLSFTHMLLKLRDKYRAMELGPFVIYIYT